MRVGCVALIIATLSFAVVNAIPLGEPPPKEPPPPRLGTFFVS